MSIRSPSSRPCRRPGVGAVLALLLFDTEFSIIALIGVILLIGIVKKNAIMMIDFALDAEREQGIDAEDAIYQACLLRFRPIMMTTMAAMLGALPLALGIGDGAELRQPLGISIVGGLIVSQVLTLYTTPVVYLYLDRFRAVALRRGAGAIRPTPRAGAGRMSARRRVIAGASALLAASARSGPTISARGAGAGGLQGTEGLEAGDAARGRRRSDRGGRSTTIRCSTASSARSTSPTRT